MGFSFFKLVLELPYHLGQPDGFCLSRVCSGSLRHCILMDPINQTQHQAFRLLVDSPFCLILIILSENFFDLLLLNRFELEFFGMFILKALVDHLFDLADFNRFSTQQAVGFSISLQPFTAAIGVHKVSLTAREDRDFVIWDKLLHANRAFFLLLKPK